MKCVWIPVLFGHLPWHVVGPVKMLGEYQALATDLVTAVFNMEGARLWSQADGTERCDKCITHGGGWIILRSL
jgi:hypothetical protein